MSLSYPRRDSQERKWPSYVASAEEFIAPPPAAPIDYTPQKESHRDLGMGFVVITANVFVTGIIIIGMLVYGQGALYAIVTGAIYFALTTTLYVLIHTGALSEIVGIRQREQTERQRIEAYAQAATLAIQWRIKVEDNRTLELQAQALPTQLARRVAALEDRAFEREESVAPMQTPSTFVTAFDNRSRAAFAEETQPAGDMTANEALAWARTLYNDAGDPNPAKVYNDGRLKVRMAGSSRGPGTREAGLWLIQKGVIKKVPGGFALNIKHFPTRESLRGLR